MDKSKISEDHCEVWDRIMYECETEDENDEVHMTEVDREEGVLWMKTQKTRMKMIVFPVC